MKAVLTITTAAALGCLASMIPARAADIAAGQKIFQDKCSDCHDTFKDYAGKSQADIETDIKGIVAGTVKHKKKLTLSPDDIANVAAYIAKNAPPK
jgi:mono/diheme cytochrome c family protein